MLTNALCQKRDGHHWCNLPFDHWEDHEYPDPDDPRPNVTRQWHRVHTWMEIEMTRREHQLRQKREWARLDLIYAEQERMGCDHESWEFELGINGCDCDRG